jgi:hypothetical protein
MLSNKSRIALAVTLLAAAAAAAANGALAATAIEYGLFFGF